MSHTLHRLPTAATSPMLSGWSQQRIGDAERSAACDELAQAFSQGCLSAEELDERMELAVAARTRLDLLRLTSDLPAEARTPATSAAPQTTAARPNQARTAIIATFGVLTFCAFFCTLLLLGVASLSQTGGMVGLGVFGSAVASSGITYFVTRRGD